MLRMGNPGNKGGNGRVPSKFSSFMQSLGDDENVHKAIRKAAQDEGSKGFAPVLKAIQDYDPDKPSDRKELTGEVTIRVARDD